MPIDARDIQILGYVENACSQISVEWMLVGALARDLHLVEAAGIDASRATNDVDIAAAVESWEIFASLKELLIGSQKFVASNNVQRLLGVDDLRGRQLDGAVRPRRRAVSKRRARWLRTKGIARRSPHRRVPTRAHFMTPPRRSQYSTGCATTGRIPCSTSQP